jgi:NAD(P)-dependent dehydrogenase (short-subunit alcohol dehydrogenase family)
MILQGRTILITGASKGIGYETAKQVALAGGHVVALARSKDDLEKLDDDIFSLTKHHATLIPFDLKKLDDLEALGPLLHDKLQTLDGFVANAGILGSLSPLAHCKMREFQDVMTVNLTANIQLIRTLSPLLLASSAGRAVFLTSGKGLKAEAYWSAYAISKAALTMAAQIWAEETKNTNLRVNLLRPGVVHTQMIDMAFPGGYQGSMNEVSTVGQKIVAMLSPDETRHGQIVQL